MIVIASWIGTHHLPEDAGLFRTLHEGLKQTSFTYFAWPGLLVGVGATLGANGARQSLVYGLVASFAIACALTVVLVFGFLSGETILKSSAQPHVAVDSSSSHSSFESVRALATRGEGLRESTARSPASETQTFKNDDLKIGAMIFLSIFSFLFAFGGTAIASSATAIVGHVGLDLVNDIPMPWNDRFAGWQNDVAGGSLIVGTALLLFVFPAVQSLRFYADPLAEARYAIADLPKTRPSHPEGPLILTERGRKIRKEKFERFQKHFESVQKGDCWKLATFDEAIESYFRAIVYSEGWEPGKELSDQAKRVVEMTSNAFERKQVGWSDLSRYVTIHLDKSKYGRTVAIVPNQCIKDQ
jgi:hypothetical protein